MSKPFVGLEAFILFINQKSLISKSKNMRLFLCFVLLGIGLLACQPAHKSSSELLNLTRSLVDLPVLRGKSAYLASPFTTAGNQMYLVGHQDGRFPDLGWHIEGEMGGLWLHPIKLTDGFVVELSHPSAQRTCLDQAVLFKNYPIASQHDFLWPEFNLEIQRTQFVTDSIPGLVVEVQIKNKGSASFEGNLNFTNQVDLRPVWLGERTGMEDQPDEIEYDQQQATWMAKDQGNNWYCVWRASLPGEESLPAACTPETTGQGAKVASIHTLNIPAGGRQVVQFYITGSSASREEALQRLEILEQDLLPLFRAKRNHYQRIAQTAVLEVPDTILAQAWEWTKYASQWLRFDLPQGTGIAAGIPDYPWWFGCDQTYSVRGLVTVGMGDWAVDILGTLLDLSDKAGSEGRIVHEVSTNGAVFNPGNINETPHFISAAWEVFRWTGDEVFLRRAYEQAQAGLTWLDEQDEDGNGYPDGHGMMEIPGMDAEMIDVIAYSYEAYRAAAAMANYFGDTTIAEAYTEKADGLARRINTEWWVVEEASFADFRATTPKALSLLEAAIVRADTLEKPWSVRDLEAVRSTMLSRNSDAISAYAFYHNWVVNTPLETGGADSAKAMQALATGDKYINPFGVYVTGIDRKKEETNPEAFAALKAKESFNYTGAVMTLPTGVQAISAARYGQADLALEYLQRMLRSFSYAHPGSMYEVSPDYGMLVQAWNIYALARPIVSHFFGIQPEVHQQKIYINPNLPSVWQEVAIYKLPLGKNQLDYRIQGNQHQIVQQLDWNLVFTAPFGKKITRINGVPTHENNKRQVVLTAKRNLLIVE